MYKGVGVRFADFISFILNISRNENNLVSLRPNYFIFIGYLKQEVGEPPEPICNALTYYGLSNIGHYR